ncbi:DUF2147 domain-containing protein [Methylobacterium gregans]|uniref:DUF2147 domain-containing protein n=1 Tax=Methylobacterium gregans TaxID=374424 RepID=A0AA37HQF9_9HYPH|nr:DUF2147 domain-containing protein [Methylobacterium gregans]MDQ0521616.1 uncharacterized protein (DUF2147 family) [Methylobacterium gregans]GJD80142.1 hypothetical protein NBEOAGPD_3381 [Methylobacterium gregans]GLS55389.1 hypothetical protein GCM10007886_35740 [Methylobacterium gregans]
MTPRRRSTLRAAGLLAALLAAAPGHAAGDPSGIWLTETGDSKVRLARCGAGYCGTLVSVSGKGLDANNPDPALRGRSVVGVQIVNAPNASGDGYSGTLYNPKDGKTYSGTLKMTGPNTVEVSGCVMSVFCKSQTWKRAN